MSAYVCLLLPPSPGPEDGTCTRTRSGAKCFSLKLHERTLTQRKRTASVRALWVGLGADCDASLCSFPFLGNLMRV